MLVLSRCIGEEILIGDDVRIVIVGVVGGRVRIGVEAPPDVNIVRAEIAAPRPPQRKQPPAPPADETGDFSAGIPK